MDSKDDATVFHKVESPSILEPQSLTAFFLAAFNVLVKFRLPPMLKPPLIGSWELRDLPSNLDSTVILGTQLSGVLVGGIT